VENGTQSVGSEPPLLRLPLSLMSLRPSAELVFRFTSSHHSESDF
jgi:hypothetical protein